MERRTHRADRWLLGLAAAAGALLLVATLVSGGGDRPHRPAAATAPMARDGRLVYDLALMNAAGELLARPRVLGRAGHPLLLSYRGEGQASFDALTVGLDALVAADGLDLALDLSVDEPRAHRLRLRLPLAERRTIRIPRPSGDLYLAIHALAVDSPEFEAWAQGVRARDLGRGIPEA